MKQIKKLTETEFQNYLLESPLLIVDFGADWCPPCKALEPVLLELQNDFPQIQFTKVDVDKEEKLAAQFGVKSLPTVLFFKDGALVETLIGYRPKSQYKNSIEKNFTN